MFKFKNGAPGRLWSHPEARVDVDVVDARLQQVTLQGQELMTRDKVTLRLTLTVEYAPADVATMAHAVASARDAVYLMVQLAVRDYVGAVTLDELLEGREAMTRHLEQAVTARARELGIAVRSVGVRGRAARHFPEIPGMRRRADELVLFVEHHGPVVLGLGAGNE